MRRRAFITGLAWSGFARRAGAQQTGRTVRVALVSPANPLALMTDDGAPYYRALLQELRLRGYTEGQNLVLERYSGGGAAERYQVLVDTVVSAKPDLIFTQSNRLVRMFKTATTSIPIVAYMSDPVAIGLVASFARPGGNITGMVSYAGLEIQGKHVELLKEVTGGRLSRIGYLVSRTTSEQRAPIVLTLEGAAEALGISVVAGALDDFQERDYTHESGYALLSSPHRNRALCRRVEGPFRPPVLRPSIAASMRLALVTRRY